MSKGKSITLLTIVSVLMAFVLVMTFVRFPIGVKDYNSLLGAVELGYDMSGGVSYTLTLNENNEEEVGEEEIKEVVSQLKLRLETLGYENYVIKTLKSTDKDVKDFDIRIEIEDTDSCDTDMLAVTTYGELKFYGGAELNPTTEILEDVKVIEDSSYVGQLKDGGYVISIILTEEGRKALLDEIADTEGSFYLKIACGYDNEGNEIALFNPQEAFDSDLLADDNRALSLSAGSIAEAKQMALQFKYGGIDYKYDVSNNGVGVKIDSPYGTDIALKSAVAIMTLVVCIIIVLLVIYKGFGLITSLSTLLFILAEGWLLIGVPGVVVTLGSIVGIIMATIVCLYAMVILSQRVKDEFANSEKTAKAAINKGFKEALVPTISVHVVSGIFAILLLIFAKGILYSFAVTFGIGLAVSLISTLVFTRMFNALIFPLPKDKEKFLKIKRNERANGEV